MDYEEVRIETINNGAAKELFEEEFKKVLANINDISVESDAVRSITLVFTIKPSKDRMAAVTTVEARTKLASVLPHGSSIFLSFNKNVAKAFVNNIKQTTMNFEASQEEKQEVV